MILGYLFSMMKIFFSGKHLLMVLLGLEGLMIIVLYFLMSEVGSGKVSVLGLMMYMMVMVSEGALGLGILVIMVRSVGGDKFFFTNLL